MASASKLRRTHTYKPALAWFAAIGAVWVFVLVTLGAFTTSIGAGMVFPDWPLSNGSLNPEGWLNDLAMFAEHSHRLTGMLMGFITISLAVWLHLGEGRGWVRKLGWWALGIVVIQGLIGGQRVRLDALEVPGFEMSLGQMLRIPHGVLAHVYVGLLIVIALALSRRWLEASPLPVSSRTRVLGLWCVGLLLVQLIIAAVMRHNYAGLAIPTFPWSTPEGDLLPQTWNFRVTVHFLHRVMAVILSVALVWFAIELHRDRAVTKLMRSGAVLLIAALILQIGLGAKIIWTMRNAHMTTGHVVIGALLLATATWLTTFAYRDKIEKRGTA